MNNMVKQKLSNNETVLGTFFQMGSTTAMECLGITGLDYTIIDTEHGPFDVESAMDYIRVAELKNITPFVRIKDITRSSILKMLDAGAKGLIIPCVETVEQVKNIVEYGKYSPVGKRGFIYGRVSEYGNSEDASSIDKYMKICNDNTMLIPQCETIGCLENIEEIVAMDGVDGIFVGPYDLSISMGVPGQFDNPEFKKALKRVLDACRNSSKPILIFTGSIEAAKSYFEEGYNGVAYNLDTAMYINAFRKAIEQIKS
ncbi:MAG: aldolase/citrate lyase family protein [Sedimentibacter saalensis]|uniref:HpcH/HpaI aldolase family protein n=1 Tax=Sedimentibacter saalensis TaxID=130788 RepID=UPI00315921F7